MEILAREPVLGDFQCELRTQCCIPFRVPTAASVRPRLVLCALCPLVVYFLSFSKIVKYLALPVSMTQVGLTLSRHDGILSHARLHIARQCLEKYGRYR